MVRILGHRLHDVPQLRDPVVLEPEEVDDGEAAIRRRVPDVRMHGDERAVKKGVLHIDLRVRMGPCGVLHPRHQ
jgi:hypothetical protein